MKLPDGGSNIALRPLTSLVLQKGGRENLFRFSPNCDVVVGSCQPVGTVENEISPIRVDQPWKRLLCLNSPETKNVDG